MRQEMLSIFSLAYSLFLWDYTWGQGAQYRYSDSEQLSDYERLGLYLFPWSRVAQINLGPDSGLRIYLLYWSGLCYLLLELTLETKVKRSKLPSQALTRWHPVYISHCCMVCETEIIQVSEVTGRFFSCFHPGSWRVTADEGSWGGRNHRKEATLRLVGSSHRPIC